MTSPPSSSYLTARVSQYSVICNRDAVWVLRLPARWTFDRPISRASAAGSDSDSPRRYQASTAYLSWFLRYPGLRSVIKRLLAENAQVALSLCQNCTRTTSMVNSSPSKLTMFERWKNELMRQTVEGLERLNFGSVRKYWSVLLAGHFDCPVSRSITVHQIIWSGPRCRVHGMSQNPKTFVVCC